MAILQQYRRPGSGVKSSYRRAVFLAAILCLAAGMFFLSGDTPPADDGAAEGPAPPSAPVDPTPAPLPGWAPLAPRKERELLGKLVDQVPIGVREHARAYYYLLKKAHHTTEAQLEEDLDKGTTYEEFAYHAEAIRGSVVQVFGLLMRLEKTLLQDPEKAGLPAVYEGQIIDAKRNIYSFSLTEPPRPPLVPGRVQTRDRLRVRLCGIFMQNIVYKSRHIPPRLIATPLIIGRRLFLAQGGGRASGARSWVWTLLLAIAGLLLALRIVITVFRRPETSRRMPRPEE